MLAFGAWFVLLALWDLSDQSFGSSLKWASLFVGPVVDHVSGSLFDTFGHWGPRGILIVIGILLVATSFPLVAGEKEHKTDHQPSHTKTFAVLSWTLVILVLSLLALIVVGPLLRNPAIDDVLSYWREWYYAPAAFLTLIFTLVLTLRWNLEAFGESGDPWWLMRPSAYLLIAIIVVVFLSWKFHGRIVRWLFGDGAI
jgi:hypothetical protein